MDIVMDSSSFGMRRGGGSGSGLRMATYEPRVSVLSALPQLGGLERLVLEQWMGATGGSIGAWHMDAAVCCVLIVC